MRKIDKLNTPAEIAAAIYRLVEAESYYNSTDKQAVIRKVSRALNLRTWIVHAVINRMDLSKWNY